MKFAVFALPTYHEGVERRSKSEFFRELTDLLVSAEDLGFDGIWANEHHFDAFGGLIPSPPLLLAHLAGRTSRVRLGTSVVCLPLHHPIEIAEQMAMADLLSGGRVELGLGRGFVQYDYDVMGIPYAEAQDRLKEGLELLLQAWSGRPVSFSGRYYQGHNATVWPTPEQRPHPPIWIACTTTPDSFKWTGERGYDLLTVAYLRPLADLAALIDAYREARRAAGHSMDRAEIATHYQIVVGPDGDRARRTAEDAQRRYLELNLETHIRSGATAHAERVRAQLQDLSIDRLVDESRIVAGTPTECVAQLRIASERLGFTQVHCGFVFGGIDLETGRDSMRLFAAEVMPRLRAAAPAARRT